jgi:filamentous hemagglutinin
VERLLAETAAGCGAALISGDSCGNGMKTALVTTSLAWANREMRNAVIEESKRAPGICDTSGGCSSNASGKSVGVEGDAFKAAGGRLDYDKWCAQGMCAVDRATGELIRDDQGRVVFSGGMYTYSDGRTVQVKTLSDYILARPELRSPMGGLQGGDGLFAFFGYPPGAFWDRVNESYAGPHDTFNRPTWYGPDGNIRLGMTEAERLIGEITSYLNVIPATPFAGATLIPRGSITAIGSAMRGVKAKERGK